MITDAIQSLMSYARAFEEENCERFVDVCITDVVEDVMSYNLFASNSRATYIQYIRVSKVMIKHQGVLLLLEKMGKNAPATNTFGITHLDNHSLYTSSGKDMLLMI